MSSGSMPGILHVLDQWAAAAPERTAFVYLARGEEPSGHLSYAQLADKSARIASALKRGGASAGDRIALVLPPGLDFVTTLFATLRLGAVAVPLPRSQSNLSNTGLRALLGSANPRLIVADNSLAAALLSEQSGQPANAGIIAVEALEGAGALASWPDITLDQPAMVQFTSGSTTSPRGVVVTHGMLAANAATIQEAFAHSEQSVFVSWLPHFHDMGLVGTILQPVFCGASSYLMAPAAFLQRPARWLQAIGRFGGTCSGGPNFAFDLCVAAIDDATVGGLNLSSWDVAFNGAELVREKTIRTFAEKFRPAGFRMSSMLPCYGLAENTLFVAGGPTVSGPSIVLRDPPNSVFGATVVARTSDHAHPIVAAGVPGRHVTVRIVDALCRSPVPDGHVGEVWVAGPAAASTYLNDPAQSEARLRNVLPSEKGHFIRTGDLGFLHDGKLFITGRLDDVTIINGRNLHPEDVEAATVGAFADRGLRRVVAFGIDDGVRQTMTVVAGVRPDSTRNALDSLARDMQALLAQQFDNLPIRVILTRTSTIPVTSSGKVRRNECRYLLTALQLPILWDRPGRRSSDSPNDVIDEAVLRAVGAIASRRIDTFEVDATPSQLGFDSIMVVRLQSLMERLGHRSFSLGEIARTSLRSLFAGVVERSESQRGSPPATVPPQASIGQRAFAYASLSNPAHRRHTIAFAFKVEGKATIDRLRDALDKALARHDSFRMRFAPNGMPSLSAAPAVAMMDAADGESAWSKAVAESERPLAMTGAGPLVSATIHVGPAQQYLVIRLHHSVTDLLSLGLLLDDFNASLSQRRLEPPSRTFADSVAHQCEFLASSSGTAAVARWRERLAGLGTDIALSAHARPPQDIAEASLVPIRMGSDVEQPLLKFAFSLGTTPYTVLLTVFALVLGRLSGESDFVVASPFHGRLSPADQLVVGLFTNTVPLPFHWRPDASFVDLVRDTERTVRDCLDDGAIPLATLAGMLHGDHPVNHRVRFDAMFTLQATSGRFAAPLARAAAREIGSVFDLGEAQLTLAHLPPMAIDTSLDMALALVDGIKGYLAFDPRVIMPALANTIASGFEQALRAGIADPAIKAMRLPLMTDQTRERILEDWALGPMAGEPGGSVSELFSIAAAKAPNHPAVVEAGVVHHYTDLAIDAARIAMLLRGRRDGSRK